MLRFPDGGLLKTFRPSATASARPTFVPAEWTEAVVYPSGPADRLLAALSRVQQANTVLEQVAAKPGYRQSTLLNRENATAVCKRKRDLEDRNETKKVKVVQQTLAAFVNKV